MTAQARVVIRCDRCGQPMSADVTVIPVNTGEVAHAVATARARATGRDIYPWATIPDPDNPDNLLDICGACHT